MRKFREFLQETLAMSLLEFIVYLIILVICIILIFIPQGRNVSLLTTVGVLILLSVYECKAKLNKIIAKQSENDREKLLCKEYELKEKFAQAQHERAKEMINK